MVRFVYGLRCYRISESRPQARRERFVLPTPMVIFRRRPNRRASCRPPLPRVGVTCCEAQPLGRRSSSGLFQNLHRLAHLRDSEDQEGGVGVGFGSAVAVVYVDPRVAEPR